MIPLWVENNGLAVGSVARPQSIQGIGQPLGVNQCSGAVIHGQFGPAVMSKAYTRIPAGYSLYLEATPMKVPFLMPVASAFALGLSLSACSFDDLQAHQAVKQILKDPSSASFGKLTRLDDKHACLTVNAKNSFGGYSGGQEAWLAKANGKWVAFHIGSGGKDFCLQEMPRLRDAMVNYPLR